MANSIVVLEEIKTKIIVLRDMQIMLDADLAGLYGVSVKVLNQAVKRNIKRFPADFMFRLSREEKAQVVTNCDHLKGLKYSYQMPYAFTRDGVAMLSSVLNSDRAINVNIQIMRVFGKTYELLPNYKRLVKEVEELKGKVSIHGDRLEANFKSIIYILKNLPKPK